MNTDITRRIDDLGRIVIPKEVRCKMHLKEGDRMAIAVEDRTVILTPYTPLSDVSLIIDTCFHALAAHKEMQAIVTTKQEILTSADPLLPKYTQLSAETQGLIYQHKRYRTDGTHPIPVVDVTSKYVLALYPIMQFGELYGSLILYGKAGEIPNESTLEKGRLLADIIHVAVSELE